jgi:hypothetical protein
MSLSIIKVVLVHNGPIICSSFLTPVFFFTPLARNKFQKIRFSKLFSNVNLSKIYTKKNSKKFFSLNILHTKGVKKISEGCEEKISSYYVSGITLAKVLFVQQLEEGHK